MVEVVVQNILIKINEVIKISENTGTVDGSFKKDKDVRVKVFVVVIITSMNVF